MLKKMLPVVVLVGLLTLAFPVFVAAQAGDSPAAAPKMGMTAGSGFANRGAQRGGWLTVGVSMVDAAAEALGMEVADVVAALKEGKTFAKLADEQGVNPQAIVDVMIDSRSEALAQAVADGRLTQEQADEMLARMANDLPERLESEHAPRGAGNGYALEGAPSGWGGLPRRQQ
jgi:hypothetical protein